MLMRAIRLEGCGSQADACLACEVRASALFRALDEAGLQRIHDRIQTLAFAADQPVYLRGDSAAAVFTIRAGIVRFERVTSGGDRRIVRLAGRGDLIGAEALLGAPYADEAVACNDVELCRIPAPLIDELGRRDGAVQKELMRRWQAALEDAEDWVADLAMGPARARLLRLLARLARHADPGHLIWLPRRDEMSAMLNMAVETASRLVSQLRREGILMPVGARGARLHPAALETALAREDARD